jgi:hypothetical protein
LDKKVGQNVCTEFHRNRLQNFFLNDE